MSANDDFEAFLAAQRREYGENLARRVAAIRVAWQRAAASRTEDDYRTVEREAHSIAGSGGTFGYPVAGAAALALEQAVERRDHAAIEPALLRLEDAVRHAG
jgi:chemotaxis protein histidine kinase CheA